MKTKIMSILLVSCLLLSILLASCEETKEMLDVQKNTETEDTVKNDTDNIGNTTDSEGEGNIAHIHTPVIDAAVEPKCKENGLTEGSHCSECGEVIVQQQTIPAEHKFENNYCTVCGQKEKSEGLAYKLDGDSYKVTGMGTCTDTDIVIPAVYEGKPVTAIASGAFYSKNNIVSVIIPNSVATIGANAFYGCTKITEIIIPDSVTKIETIAFKDCLGLKSLTIGSNVKDIGESAFYNCKKLTTIYYDATEANDLPESNGVFYKAGTDVGTKLIIGANVKKIPANLFYANYSYVPLIKKVEFSQGSVCESIGANAFLSCKRIAEVHISDMSLWFNMKFANSNSNPFYYSDYLKEYHSQDVVLYLNNVPVTDVTIPESCTEISDYLFYGYSLLETVVMHDNVTSVGVLSFYRCKALSNVIIPGSVTKIDRGAFQECTKLSSVSFAIPTGWGYSVSNTVTGGETISSTDLENTSTAANYLTNKYSSYYWYRT